MAEQAEVIVEMLYELAKSGQWDKVLRAFDEEPRVAAKCSRYRRGSSGWTFLHQAAYSGHEGAARGLIRMGASLTARSTEGQTPADVANTRHHEALGRLLEAAAQTGAHLWEAHPDPGLLPSSNAWDEQRERRAEREMKVAYAGGVVVIPPGARYFADSFERVVVGWHGSYDPPRGM